ncbi:MAG TPA: hypothetical protein DCS97_01385 [Planctomycetes bacterium]|nr:hypothetical protein [Planctomycetota bacterium]
MDPILIAIILGAAFGILLHKGGVTDYGRILGVFLFRDFTVLKIMLTAIVVGGLGVHLLVAQGFAAWEVKGADLWPVVIGSALFGIGMAVYGYCPGTGVAAAATGRMDALIGLGGMLAGGVLYAYTSPTLLAAIAGRANLGKVRLGEVTGLPSWAWFAILIVIAGSVFALISRIERRRAAGRPPE